MELCHRLTGNGSEDLIRRLQRSVNMAQSLPEPLYGAVKEAYIASFRRVFTLAAFAAFGAYLSMIPVRVFVYALLVSTCFDIDLIRLKR